MDTQRGQLAQNQTHTAAHDRVDVLETRERTDTEIKLAEGRLLLLLLLVRQGPPRGRPGGRIGGCLDLQEEYRRRDVYAVAHGEHGPVDAKGLAKQIEYGYDGRRRRHTLEEVLCAVVVRSGALAREHRPVEEDVEGVVKTAAHGRGQSASAQFKV